MTSPHFLDDDGNASLSSLVLLAHHGLRRDLAQFGFALVRLTSDPSGAATLKAEWQAYRDALERHERREHADWFAHLRTNRGDITPLVEALDADRRSFDGLLVCAEAAFQNVPRRVQDAVTAVSQLAAHLQPHLATEEAKLVPILRAIALSTAVAELLLPLDVDELAWISHGVAPAVLDRVYEQLPLSVTKNIEAARSRFECRCEQAWGSAEAGASVQAIPTWLTYGGTTPT